MVELVRGIGDGLGGGDQHRHVGGKAARHRGVDGEELGGDDAVALGDLAEHVVGLEAGGVEEGAYALLGGRDHGQPVGPAALIVELDGCVHTLSVQLLGAERLL